MFQHLYRKSLIILLLFFVHTNYASVLTLNQAEKAAVGQSPELKALHAKTDALTETAVAVGQLSDPKLAVGAINVPVDSFNFAQENMTQIRIGLKQAFPRGHSLHYRSLQKHYQALAENERIHTMQSHVLRGVRINWLNLYYWVNAKRIVLAQKKVFQHLVKVAESMLANNKAQQKDVIRAQLELTELDNRLIEIDQHIDTARAALARWISPELARQAKPKQLPNWEPPSSLLNFYEIIKHHSELQTDQEFIAASHAGVKLAEQQYKPGFTVGVAYGIRQGQNTGRPTQRDDFLSAEVTFDLPIFTRNRQDRTLNARLETLAANQEEQYSHYRQLREALVTQYVAWREQRNSSKLYQKRLIREAKQYAEATMSAYQNTQTDFPTLARAYIRELETELGGLKAMVNRDKSRANLLYLEGK